MYRCYSAPANYRVVHLVILERTFLLCEKYLRCSKLKTSHATLLQVGNIGNILDKLPLWCNCNITTIYYTCIIATNKNTETNEQTNKHTNLSLGCILLEVSHSTLAASEIKLICLLCNQILLFNNINHQGHVNPFSYLIWKKTFSSIPSGQRVSMQVLLSSAHHTCRSTISSAPPSTHHQHHHHRHHPNHRQHH